MENVKGRLAIGPSLSKTSGRGEIGRRQRSDHREVGCGQQCLDFGLLVDDSRRSRNDGGALSPGVGRSRGSPCRS